MFSGLICSVAVKTATAIAKSIPAPVFGKPAGESETVTFLFGQTRLLFRIEAFTRSLDSATCVSANPTIEKPGNPSPISTSTSIKCPVTPTTTTDLTIACFKIQFLSNGRSWDRYLEFQLRQQCRFELILLS